MSGKSDPRRKTSLAHTALVLSDLLSGSVISILPGPGEDIDDDHVDEVLDDVEEVRLAVSGLVDALCADYPDFMQEYTAHRLKMKVASARHNETGANLKLV